MTHARLILASASPRRRELLERAGLCFEVEPANVDEGLEPGLEPEQAAVLLAQRKAQALAQRRAGQRLWLLAADTIVALPLPHGGWQLLGKAADEEEERSMLRLLSGSRHAVVTGVCAMALPGPGSLAQVQSASAFERTWVRMCALSEAQIEAYIATGAWRDKAGGYAIQEGADRFVVELREGGYDNVVGLPVALSLRLLDSLGLPR